MLSTDLFQPFAAPARVDALRQPVAVTSARRRPRAILIQRARLAGFRHHAGERLQGAMPPGTTLQLVREADNPHDPCAVAIYWHHYQLGYLARRDNTVIASLLDNQRSLRCTLERLWWRGEQADIELAIWLERPGHQPS